MKYLPIRNNNGLKDRGYRIPGVLMELHQVVDNGDGLLVSKVDSVKTDGNGLYVLIVCQEADTLLRSPQVILLLAGHCTKLIPRGSTGRPL